VVGDATRAPVCFRLTLRPETLDVADPEVYRGAYAALFPLPCVPKPRVKQTKAMADKEQATRELIKDMLPGLEHSSLVYLQRYCEVNSSGHDIVDFCNVPSYATLQKNGKKPSPKKPIFSSTRPAQVYQRAVTNGTSSDSLTQEPQKGSSRTTAAAAKQLLLKQAKQKQSISSKSSNAAAASSEVADHGAVVSSLTENLSVVALSAACVTLEPRASAKARKKVDHRPPGNESLTLSSSTSAGLDFTMHSVSPESSGSTSRKRTTDDHQRTSGGGKKPRVST